MKSLILTILVFASTASANGAFEIRGWDSALPEAQELITKELSHLAMDMYQARVVGLELTDYYTYESYTGELTHKVKVSFILTEIDGRMIAECTAPLTVRSSTLVEFQDWYCK